ncbi:MAG: FecR domain-containing protein [Elusimicrobia bacterium]|nr:FecR domain-containing protein [Elusimicrobiota bacterium]
MKRAWLGLIMASSLARPATAGEGWDFRLMDVQGSVTVYTQEEPGGAAAQAGLPLEAGDRVSAGPNGSAEIGIGGKSLIALKSGSEIVLSSPQPGGALIELGLGSLLAKLEPLLPGQSLRVRTPTAVAAVRGTEFGVEFSAEEKETLVGVFDEGRVEVSGGSGAMETLQANQETSISEGKPPLQPYVLRRLARQRAFMRAIPKRLRRMAKEWKALPPAQRRALRRRAFEEMRRRKEDRLQRQRLRDRRGPAQKRPRPDQERMERRREEIRRRRRTP